MKKEEEKKKIVFDVINSVEGGSGKSTLSLLLAAYHAFQPNTVSYIIDLDLRGTSWMINYGEYLLPKGRAPIFVNDLMYDYKRKSGQELFARIDAKTGKDRTASIHLSMGDPDIGGNIGQPDVEEDLFENAIYCLIDQIYTFHSEDSDKVEEIHVILDMPPSYDRNAERILKHLLLDANSTLYRNAQKSSGKYGNFDRYKVNLFMVSGLTPAHVTLNRDYVKNLFQKVNYSGVLMQFLEPDKPGGENRFHLFFIGNDSSGIIPLVTRATIVDRINRAIMPDLRSTVSSDGIDAADIMTGFNLMNHIKIQSVIDYYNEQVQPTTISIPEAALDDVKLLLK